MLSLPAELNSRSGLQEFCQFRSPATPGFPQACTASAAGGSKTSRGIQAWSWRQTVRADPRRRGLVERPQGPWHNELQTMGGDRND